MGTSDWLVVQYQGRDVWKCATMRHGALSVMVYGQPTMPTWPADNWDSLDLVCVWCVCVRVCVCMCVCVCVNLCLHGFYRQKMIVMHDQLSSILGHTCSLVHDIIYP